MIYYYYIYKNFNNMAQNVHHATIHMSQVGKKFIAQIVVKKLYNLVAFKIWVQSPSLFLLFFL